MSQYRVNGKTVETIYRGEWIVVYYCQNEEAAAKCLERCIERARQPFDPLSVLRDQQAARDGAKGEK